MFGTLIAWVLVRDEFPGKRIVNALIDLPFALPTIVAGVVLLALYGKGSPVGIDVGVHAHARSAWRCCSSRCRSSCARCSRCCIELDARDGGGGRVARRAAR